MLFLFSPIFRISTQEFNNSNQTKLIQCNAKYSHSNHLLGTFKNNWCDKTAFTIRTNLHKRLPQNGNFNPEILALHKNSEQWSHFSVITIFGKDLKIIAEALMPIYGNVNKWAGESTCVIPFLIGFALTHRMLMHLTFTLLPPNHMHSDKSHVLPARIQRYVACDVILYSEPEKRKELLRTAFSHKHKTNYCKTMHFPKTNVGRELSHFWKL